MGRKWIGSGTREEGDGSTTTWVLSLAGVGPLVVTLAVGCKDWRQWPPVVWAALAFGVVALIIGIWLGERRRRALRGAEDELSEARGELERCKRVAGDYEEVISRELRRITEHIEDFRETERISLYRHQKVGAVEQFVLAGRFSPDPVLGGTHRRAYPSNQGCIYQAWRNRVHYEQEWPDSTKSGWRTRHRNLGLTDDTIGNLKMKSRWYYAERITSRAPAEELAVVVFESEKPDWRTKDSMEKSMNMGWADQLCESLVNWRDIEPKPDYADGVEAKD